jgi:hypothetical protein
MRLLYQSEGVAGSPAQKSSLTLKTPPAFRTSIIYTETVRILIHGRSMQLGGDRCTPLPVCQNCDTNMSNGFLSESRTRWRTWGTHSSSCGRGLKTRRVYYRGKSSLGTQIDDLDGAVITANLCPRTLSKRVRCVADDIVNSPAVVTATGTAAPEDAVQCLLGPERLTSSEGNMRRALAGELQERPIHPIPGRP